MTKTTSILSLEPLQTSQQSPHVHQDALRDAKISSKRHVPERPRFHTCSKTIIKHQRFTLLPTLGLSRNAQSNICIIFWNVQRKMTSQSKITWSCVCTYRSVGMQRTEKRMAKGMFVIKPGMESKISHVFGQ